MERREFFKRSMAASGLALVPALLGAAAAHAETACVDDFEDIKGYGGRFKKRSLWTNKDEEAGQASCLILLAEPGVVVPPHAHPGGEYVFVIDGAIATETTYPDGRRVSERFTRRESRVSPPGTIHHREVSEGARILVFEPVPLKLL